MNQLTIGYKYKPLPPELTIKESLIEGLGLFAVKPIEKETIIGLTHKSDFSFENGYIRTPLGGFINHHEEPNCRLIPRPIEGGYVLYLETLKPIESGEEITTKYFMCEQIHYSEQIHV